MVRDTASRRARSCLRGACHTQAGPEGVASQVGAYLVLRPAAYGGSFARPVFGYKRVECRGGASDEIFWLHHRQLMDVQAALQTLDPQSDGSSQHIM